MNLLSFARRSQKSDHCFSKTKESICKYLETGFKSEIFSQSYRKIGFKGSFDNYVDKNRGEGVSRKSTGVPGHVTKIM